MVFRSEHHSQAQKAAEKKYRSKPEVKVKRAADMRARYEKHRNPKILYRTQIRSLIKEDLIPIGVLSDITELLRRTFMEEVSKM